MLQVLRINEIRNLIIYIDARPGQDDNTFFFSQGSSASDQSVYAFQSLQLNYSIITSQVTSSIVIGFNQPLSPDNVFRSGQPITVTDNGETVFQGTLLTPIYTENPIDEQGQGGLFMNAVLAPSIYDLVLLPAIFDATQASQINQLTGLNVASLFIGNVTQSIPTQQMLEYMITNTRYSNYFSQTINANDLDENIYIMSNASDKRDAVIRKSIDYYNCIFYQQESGIITIRQLDASVECPFDVDLSNASIGGGDENNVTIAPLLTYTYVDNAYSTPAVVSNYAILSPEQAIPGNTTTVLSYSPSPDFFPAIAQLQQGGWFVGENGITQLNENILNNPTTAQVLQNFSIYKDQYMVSTQATGVKSQFYAAYQALLTAKQLAKDLANYSNLTGVISLDDKNLAKSDLGSVLGTILQIQSCDMQSGLIATVSRTYGLDGSYLAFSAVPLGSYTGYWKNSNFTPNFG